MLYHCCEAVRLHVQGLKSEKSIARREHTVLHRLILGKREQEAKKHKNVGDIFFIGIYESYMCNSPNKIQSGFHRSSLDEYEYTQGLS
jgi:hypothetical protein